jgi:hypothetical protein
VFEGKCLKEGLRNGAEASIPFWLAHRLRRAPVCRRGRPWLSAKFGALGGVLPDSALSDSKSPRRIFRRGLNSCDDEDMPVICPDVAPFLSVSRRGFYHLRGAMGSGTQDPSRKVEALIVNPTRQEPRER